MSNDPAIEQLREIIRSRTITNTTDEEWASWKDVEALLDRLQTLTTPEPGMVERVAVALKRVAPVIRCTPWGGDDITSMDGDLATTDGSVYDWLAHVAVQAMVPAPSTPEPPSEDDVVALSDLLGFDAWVAEPGDTLLRRAIGEISNLRLRLAVHTPEPGTVVLNGELWEVRARTTGHPAVSDGFEYWTMVPLPAHPWPPPDPSLSIRRTYGDGTSYVYPRTAPYHGLLVPNLQEKN